MYMYENAIIGPGLMKHRELTMGTSGLSQDCLNSISPRQFSHSHVSKK